MYKQFKAYFETNPPSKELTVPTPPKDDDATKLQGTSLMCTSLFDLLTF